MALVHEAAPADRLTLDALERRVGASSYGIVLV